MRPIRGHSNGRPSPAGSSESGVALLLAFLVLIVLFAIVYQITTVTQTDARVTRNEITRARMDLAIRSVMMQTFEDLKEDARAAQASEGGEGGAPGGAVAPPGAAGAAPGSGSEAGELPRNPDTVDSRVDNWYTPQSTNFDDLQLRIFIRDENSKYNVLNMLNADEEVAEECRGRVVRVLDNVRGGTDLDISRSDAEEMATAMRDYMRDRRGGDDDPVGEKLTDSTESESQSVPFTFTEFRSLDVFEDHMFQDQFGEDDERLHGLDAFLTIYTSPAVGPEEPGGGIPAGTGGWGVNVNTASHAVLSALLDSRDVDYQLWDEVREYRNEEEEPVEDEEEGLEGIEDEPMLDEYGEELIPKQIFDSLDELEELFEFKDLDAEQKIAVRDLLVVESNVFEIIIAARVSTARDSDETSEFTSRREQEKFFRSGQHLVRIARAVVWRREVDDDIEIVPLIDWEIVDNAPLQILDFADEED